ncbi:hypothetical protein [Antarctobacter sp.]|uniref:hypothetical protein n=1 Tax=Antarctobacter sp. TaxID=1872577 RepID=UPI003A8F62FD
MTTPNYAITPNFTPFLRLIELQTRFAMEASQGMFKLAMLPWAGLPKGYGAVRTPMGSFGVAASVATIKAPVAETVVATTDKVIDAVAETVDAAKPAETVAVAPVKTVAPVAKAVAKTAEPVAPVATAPKAAEPAKVVAKTVTPVVEAAKPVAKAAKPVAEAAEPVAEAAKPVTDAAKPVAEAAKPVTNAAKPVSEPVKAEAVAAPVAAEAVAPAMTKPSMLAAPKDGADDLTVLNGVGPKLAEALNAEGIYKLSQIAAWSKANVAWVDENLAGVRGRASRNGWVAQAADLIK